MEKMNILYSIFIAASLGLLGTWSYDEWGDAIVRELKAIGVSGFLLAIFMILWIGSGAALAIGLFI